MVVALWEYRFWNLALFWASWLLRANSGASLATFLVLLYAIFKNYEGNRLDCWGSRGPPGVYSWFIGDFERLLN